MTSHTSATMTSSSRQDIVGRVAVGMSYPKGTGYAMTTLFGAFQAVASSIAGGADAVASIYGGSSADDPALSGSEFSFGWGSADAGQLTALGGFVRAQQVHTLLGLDIPVRSPYLSVLRDAGVRTIISYWGAPMSGLYTQPALFLRKLDVRRSGERPDHFIFESESMRAMAVQGRGISAADTSVVPTGVSPERFEIEPDLSYFSRTFGIPAGRKVIVFTGHFEARKGVDVLVRAAIALRSVYGRSDFHVLLAGNREGEESRLITLLKGSGAEDAVTFAGYRSDVPHLFRNAYVGCIPSVGWDSFPMSSLEMQAAGLPVVVSDLQGTPETIDEGYTGLAFSSGDSDSLAKVLAGLLDDPVQRDRMSQSARTRIARSYTRELQIARLAEVCRQVIRRSESPWLATTSTGSVALSSRLRRLF